MVLGWTTVLKIMSSHGEPVEVAAWLWFTGCWRFAYMAYGRKWGTLGRLPGMLWIFGMVWWKPYFFRNKPMIFPIIIILVYKVIAIWSSAIKWWGLDRKAACSSNLEWKNIMVFFTYLSFIWLPWQCVIFLKYNFTKRKNLTTKITEGGNLLNSFFPFLLFWAQKKDSSDF